MDAEVTDWTHQPSDFDFTKATGTGSPESLKPKRPKKTPQQQELNASHFDYIPKDDTNSESDRTRVKDLPKARNPPRTRPIVKATEEDARRAGIPKGYCYKNWDPTEEPVLLLGSVFDANSLGKWIYDWTAFFHGSATPLAEIAGDLWLLLIQLAGKVKRGEDLVLKIRKKESQEMVEDSIESGERFWRRLARLLKSCEACMWKILKEEKETSRSRDLQSAREFIESIFGKDRELEKTEKLMMGMRLCEL